MSNKPTQILNISPSDILNFKGPFTGEVTRYLELTNPSNKDIFFKTKVNTRPSNYFVRPNKGTIQAHGNVKIAVILQPFDYSSLQNGIRHRIMVQSAYVTDGETTLDNIWEIVPRDQLMETKLKIVYDMPKAAVSSPEKQDIRDCDKKNRYCFGIFSIRQMVFVIVKLLCLFLIKTVYLVAKDGNIKELAEHGEQIAIVGFSLCVVYGISIVLLIFSVLRRNYYLLLLNLVWQVAIVAFAVWMVFMISERVGCKDSKFSGMAVIAYLIIFALLEIWWLTILSDFCLQLYQGRKNEKSQIVKMEEGKLITENDK